MLLVGKYDLSISQRSLLFGMLAHSPTVEISFTYLVFLCQGSPQQLVWFVIWEPNEVCAVDAPAGFLNGFYQLERYTILNIAEGIRGLQKLCSSAASFIYAFKKHLFGDKSVLCTFSQMAKSAGVISNCKILD